MLGNHFLKKETGSSLLTMIIFLSATAAMVYHTMEQGKIQRIYSSYERFSEDETIFMNRIRTIFSSRKGCIASLNSLNLSGLSAVVSGGTYTTSLSQINTDTGTLYQKGTDYGPSSIPTRIKAIDLSIDTPAGHFQDPMSFEDSARDNSYNQNDLRTFKGTIRVQIERDLPAKLSFSKGGHSAGQKTKEITFPITLLTRDSAPYTLVNCFGEDPVLSPTRMCQMHGGTYQNGLCLFGRNGVNAPIVNEFSNFSQVCIKDREYRDSLPSGLTQFCKIPYFSGCVSTYGISMAKGSERLVEQGDVGGKCGYVGAIDIHTYIQSVDSLTNGYDPFDTGGVSISGCASDFFDNFSNIVSNTVSGFLSSPGGKFPTQITQTAYEFYHKCQGQSYLTPLPATWYSDGNLENVGRLGEKINVSWQRLYVKVKIVWKGTGPFKFPVPVPTDDWDNEGGETGCFEYNYLGRSLIPCW